MVGIEDLEGRIFGLKMFSRWALGQCHVLESFSRGATAFISLGLQSEVTAPNTSKCRRSATKNYKDFLLSNLELLQYVSSSVRPFFMSHNRG